KRAGITELVWQSESVTLHLPVSVADTRFSHMEFELTRVAQAGPVAWHLQYHGRTDHGEVVVIETLPVPIKIDLSYSSVVSDSDAGVGIVQLGEDPRIGSWISIP